MPGFLGNLYHRIRSFFHSIRFRLTLWYILILGVVLFLFSAFIYTRQVNDLKVIALNRLAYRSRQLVEMNRDGPHLPGDLPFTNNGNSTITMGILQENEVLAIIDPQEQVLLKMGPINDSDVTGIIDTIQQQSTSSRTFSYQLIGTPTLKGAPKQKYVFLVTAVPLQSGQLGALILGGPLDPDGQLQRLVVTLVLASLALLALAVAGGYWLAGRAMAPVQAITHTAQQIGETDLSRRINLKTEDELGQLANTFDQMLSRLQAAFNRQRQFTADASHELRTPLTIINLEASRALENRRTPQEYQQALQVIQSETDYITQLVNDLLTLARMDAGQAVLRLEPVDLSDISLEVVERLAPLAKLKGVELAAGELPELVVQGDRGYLIQMVSNLVENAIKYSCREGGCVCVETGQQDGQAWVRVEDNGIGIPADHLPHLFERFYRVDNARSQNIDGGNGANGDIPTGSGLGLSIVQWIAEAHAGSIQVESVVDKGTVFTVSLPLNP